MLPSRLYAEAKQNAEWFSIGGFLAEGVIPRLLRHSTTESAYLVLKVHNLLPTKALQSRFRRLLEAEVLQEIGMPKHPRTEDPSTSGAGRK